LSSQNLLPEQVFEWYRAVKVKASAAEVRGLDQAR
jgi:hypothetical protein